MGIKNSGHISSRDSIRTRQTQHITNFWYPHVYHSTSLDTKSRGVSVIPAHSVEWTLKDTKADALGGYLFVKGTLEETVANLYVPNTDQITFLKACLDELTTFAEKTLIFSEDLNNSFMQSS